MIPRYARKEAADIWSPQTRFSIMFQIEAHAADAENDYAFVFVTLERCELKPDSE